MLDISLAASLLKAVASEFTGALYRRSRPIASVGAGNVLQDLLQAASVPNFRLTKVFRQAEENLIIRYAHQINKGEIPKIESPFHKPGLWKHKSGCLFIDAEEATQNSFSPGQGKGGNPTYYRYRR